MAYELEINARITGLEQLNRGEAGVASLDAKTKLLNETLYGASRASENLTQTQLKYATQLAKVEEWTLRYRTAQLGATEATDRATTSVERLSRANAGAVTQVQAVGGALRTLEGAMPIRAAERFLTLIPGIGTALQAAFPIFGAIAFAEVLVRMGGNIAQLADKWNPVIAAQQRSLEILKQQTDQIVKLGAEADRLRLADIGRQRPFGQRTATLTEARQHEVAASGAESVAAAFRSQIANVEAAARRPGRVGTLGGGVQPAMSPEAAANTLFGLRTQLAEAERTAYVERQTAAGIRADLAQGETAFVTPGGLSAGDVANITRTRNILAPPTLYRPGEAPFSVDTGAFDDQLSRQAASAQQRGFEQLMQIREQTRQQQLQDRADSLRQAQLQPIQRQLSLLPLNAGLSGMSSTDQIQVRYNLQMKIAALESDLAKAERDRYEAALDREKSLLEIEKERQQAQREAFSQGVTGLIDAARHGRAGSFIRGQLDARLDEIVGQVARVIFDQIGKRRKGPLQGASWPDVLGGAAKTVDVVSDTATVSAGTVIVNGGGTAGGGPSLGGGSVPGGWNGSGPMIFNGFPGSGAPPMGGGSGGTGLSIGGIPLASIARGVAGAGALYAGIHAGGAQGGLEAAAGAVGIASAFFPPLAPVALALGIASSLFGNAKQNRADHIAHQLQANQFMSPPSINAVMTTGGTFADFDRFGNVRGSNLSPFPVVQGGYFAPGRGPGGDGQWIPVPGRVISSYGGPGGGAPSANITIQALDAKSVIDRHADIADAVARSLNLGSSPHLAETLTARR